MAEYAGAHGEMMRKGKKGDHTAAYKKGDTPKKDVDSKKDTGRGSMPKKPAKYRRTGNEKSTKDAFSTKQSKYRSG